jgi:hypothetical protein
VQTASATRVVLAMISSVCATLITNALDTSPREISSARPSPRPSQR